MNNLLTDYLKHLLSQATLGPWEYDPGPVSYTHLTLPTKA